MNSKLDKKQNTKQEEDKNFTKWKLARRKFILLPFYILKSSIKDTIEQDGIEHSGYLAFLSILSLFPFLVFLFSILTYFGN
ncbi:MAG: uncharacterized BrkB/YihY/UPF0761 family membrane protein, partial [Rickettsiales bacterium]